MHFFTSSEGLSGLELYSMLNRTGPFLTLATCFEHLWQLADAGSERNVVPRGVEGVQIMDFKADDPVLQYCDPLGGIEFGADPMAGIAECSDRR